MRRITSDLLRQKGACAGQVTLFVNLGGDQLDFTAEHCREYAEMFNFEWAAFNLLTPAAFRNYATRRTQDWTRYKQKTDEWLKKYVWRVRPNPDRFEDLWERAWARFAEARAIAFYRAWISPENQIEETAA